MYLIFDTETTGLPKRWGAPISDTDNWPRCIQIAWQLHDEMGKIIEHEDYLINLKNNGKGGILLSAHVGNWETAGNLDFRA